MEEAGSSKMLVFFHETTMCHNPEDSNCILSSRKIHILHILLLIMTAVSHCRTINYIPHKMGLIQLIPLKAIFLFFDHYFNFQHGNHISKMGS